MSFGVKVKIVINGSKGIGVKLNVMGRCMNKSFIFRWIR